jgi:cytoskeletal protein CcmA (bactofilin family)
MKKITAITSLAALVLLVAAPVRAAEFLFPKQPQNGTVSVAASEAHKNLYTAGGNVFIEGKTSGDLFAAGGSLQIAGPVEQDLAAAGGSINISGNVGSNVRASGGSVNINGQVGGDILAAGGSIWLYSSNPVGGDVVAAGGNIVLERPVKGSAKIAGGSVTINSKIDGNVSIRASKSLVFGPNAQISGKIKYQGPAPATVSDGAQLSAIEFTKTPGFNGLANIRKALGAFALLKFIAMLLAGLLLAHFLKKRVETVIKHTRDNPWANLGIGALGAIAIPVTVLILLLTVVGYYAAIVVGAWFGLISLITALITGIFLGSLLLPYLTKNQYEPSDWRNVVLGLTILAIITWIPIIGWLAATILYLMTFGGMLRMAKELLMDSR